MKVRKVGQNKQYLLLCPEHSYRYQTFLRTTGTAVPIFLRPWTIYLSCMHSCICAFVCSCTFLWPFLHLFVRSFFHLFLCASVYSFVSMYWAYMPINLMAVNICFAVLPSPYHHHHPGLQQGLAKET